MEDRQNTPSSDQRQTITTLVQLELIFLLLLLQPSGKIRKILILLWRMRFQGCLWYGSIPLLTYWGMTILLNLELPLDTGYTSRGTFPIGSPQLGSRRT